MKNIFNYRVIILDTEANFIFYERKLEERHQDCITDFCKNKKYDISYKNISIYQE